MVAAKKYLQDKTVLVLLTINIFVAFVCIGLIAWRLSNGLSGYFIVQRRANLGIDQFTQGNVVPILSFILFAILTLAINYLLSLKAYPIQRQLSIVILSFGILLLGIATIVSNALLALH